MRRECSYCNKYLGSTADGNEDKVSHGICRDCLEEAMKGTGEPLDAFLDHLEAPVFVVGDEGRIAAANELAREMVSKPASEISGNLGGEVFGCTYAKQPGGMRAHGALSIVRNTKHRDPHLFDRGSLYSGPGVPGPVRYCRHTNDTIPDLNRKGGGKRAAADRRCSARRPSLVALPDFLPFFLPAAGV